MLFEDITLIDENYTAQEHMYLSTDGKNISYIGKTAPQGCAGERMSGKNKLAVPGYFNMHCHVPMVLLRGYGDGLPLERWLNEKMFPFEDLLSSDDMYWGSVLGIAEMLASGVVSFTDMYMNMDGISRAVEEAGIKANLSHGCSAFAPDAHFKDINGWRGVHYLMDYVKTAGHDRIIPEASLHSEYTTTETVVREVAEFAKENALRLHTHISETESEHNGSKARRGGKTPTQWFEHCGVFEVPVTAAHCVFAEPDDIAIMARRGVTAVHCPSSNLKLGSGIAPVKQLIAAGVRVCVGTDGAASNNNLNMHEEITLAALLQKGASREPLFLPPSAMLELACKNGAAAQGRENCGALKVGNRADIILYDMDKPHLQPIYDVLSTLMYSAQGSDVCMTMVDGKVAYKDGEYIGIDIEKAKYNACRIRDEKLAALAAKG